MFYVYLNWTCCNKNIYLLKMLQSFYVIEDQNIITQILLTGHLIKFIWIIVLAYQVWQEMLVLGLKPHLSLVSQIVLSVSWILGPTFRVPSLVSRFPPTSYVPDLGSQVSPLGSRVSPTRWVPGLESRFPSKVSGLRSNFLDKLFTRTFQTSFCFIAN